LKECFRYEKLLPKVEIVDHLIIFDIISVGYAVLSDIVFRNDGFLKLPFWLQKGHPERIDLLFFQFLIMKLTG